MLFDAEGERYTPPGEVSQQGVVAKRAENVAIVCSVQRLAKYLCGTHFTIQCDHFPLAFLKTASYQSPRLCRWALLLQTYSFDIVHIKGSENVLADALSRLT